MLLGQASQMAAVSVLEIVLEHLALHPDLVRAPGRLIRGVRRFEAAGRLQRPGQRRDDGKSQA